MNNEKDNKKKERKTFTDYQIFQGKVRLVGENGKVEIVERDYAIQMAKESGMNLVQIAYNKNEFPHSICKILNYGKFLYEQKKTAKEAARKMRTANAEAKEIIFSIRIDDGDKNTKIDHLKKFLTEDHSRVKISIKLRRREMNMMHMARDLMKEVLTKLDGIAEMDSPPSANGGIISCVLRPTKK